MLNRVEMNIFDMLCKINLIPNRMFPETPLPNPLFTFAVKKKVAPFACDLFACIAQAGLRYCIIFLSCHIKLLGFALHNPTYTTIQLYNYTTIQLLLSKVYNITAGLR